jgi:hypothetical protein
MVRTYQIIRTTSFPTQLSSLSTPNTDAEYNRFLHLSVITAYSLQKMTAAPPSKSHKL